MILCRVSLRGKPSATKEEDLFGKSYYSKVRKKRKTYTQINYNKYLERSKILKQNNFRFFWKGE